MADFAKEAGNKRYRFGEVALLRDIGKEVMFKDYLRGLNEVDCGLYEDIDRVIGNYCDYGSTYKPTYYKPWLEVDGNGYLIKRFLLKSGRKDWLNGSERKRLLRNIEKYCRWYRGFKPKDKYFGFTWGVLPEHDYAGVVHLGGFFSFYRVVP